MPSWNSKGIENHGARSMGVSVEAIKLTMSKLHEIWRVEGK